VFFERFLFDEHHSIFCIVTVVDLSSKYAGFGSRMDSAGTSD
jgi:hypothetical protein